LEAVGEGGDLGQAGVAVQVTAEVDDPVADPLRGQVRGLVERRTVIALDAFVAVTAIGGGLALATGAEGDRFPVQWLSRTPWTSYLIPGLILAVVAGGNAALPAVTAWLRSPIAGWVTVAAGIVVAGQIFGEIVLLAQPNPPTPLEVFYLLITACMLTCGAVLHQCAHQSGAKQIIP
jgi:hypothetical protein